MKNKPRLKTFIPIILLLFGVTFQVHLVELERQSHFLEAYHWQPWRHNLLEQAGAFALSQNNPQQAIALLAQARQKNSLTTAGRLALAEAYWQNRQIEDALREWETLRAENQLQDPQLLQRMARHYHQNAEFTREAEILQTGLALMPNWVDFLWQFGLLKMAESPLEAIPIFEQIRTLDAQTGYPLTDLLRSLDRASLNDSPAYHLTLSAQSLAALGEWNLARLGLERATTSDPSYAPAWALLAEARQQTRHPEALEALQRALSLNPEEASTHAYLGLYWQRQNQPENATQAFQRAVELEPTNPYWLISLSETSFASGQLTAAYAYAAQSTRIAPQNADTWRALAIFCLKTEACLKQDGLSAALKARQQTPNDWRSAHLLGQVFMTLGEDSSARALLKRAIQLAPQEAAPRYHLGLLHLRRSETDLARENLQAALALAQGSPLAETIQRVMERYLP
jgi:tetratricopeptide (TPR) repeat protein